MQLAVQLVVQLAVPMTMQLAVHRCAPGYAKRLVENKDYWILREILQ